MSETETGSGEPRRIDIASEPPFSLGAMQVQPASREVVIGGKSQIVQPRVMQVLVALGGRCGEVVSRDELVARCWDGLAVSEDAINRCIGALRRLAEVGEGNFKIETVAKVGYRLSASVAAAGRAAPAAASSRDMIAIAVLPFANMSSDPEQEYFSDGLSEELLGQLARMNGLRVTGRTSAFAFKGHNEDLRVIGRKLGVGHIVEGSVRKAGNRLRITAQLIEVEGGYHMWSQTYDRQIDDVFAIQESVARAVTSALGVTLGIGARAPDYGGTKNFAAYDHFLKGCALMFEASPDQYAAHAEHLRKAVKVDPGYAVAWANLSLLLAYWQALLPVEAGRLLNTEKEAAAERALALAPDVPLAHVASGWARAHRRDWLGADAFYRRVAVLSAGRDLEAEAIIGGFLSVTGRARAGLPYRLRGRDSDPLALNSSEALMRSYLTLEMWDELDDEYERGKELNGHRAGAEFSRLLALMARGAGGNEIGDQPERAFDGALPPGWIALDSVPLRASPKKALAYLSQCLDTPPAQLVNVALLAGAYGGDDVAIEALGRAMPTLPSALFQALWYPSLAGARRHPRFKQFMRDAGLARFWRETGEWPDFARPLGEGDFECW